MHTHYKYGNKNNMVWLVLKDQGKLTIIVNTTQIWVMQSHVYTMFNYVHFYIEINMMMLFWILLSYEFLICFGITLLRWCQLPTCITFVVSYLNNIRAVVVGISAYHHKSCEFESFPWRDVLDTTLCDKFTNDFR